jgi:hypothetical protein
MGLIVFLHIILIALGILKYEVIWKCLLFNPKTVIIPSAFQNAQDQCVQNSNSFTCYVQV